jgi:hypothetical protein
MACNTEGTTVSEVFYSFYFFFCYSVFGAGRNVRWRQRRRRPLCHPVRLYHTYPRHPRASCLATATRLMLA